MVLLPLIYMASLASAGQTPPGDPALRRELSRLLESGQTQHALARAQTALRDSPDDAGVRHEYVMLHLALARDWLSQRRFDDSLAAVGAILAIQSDNESARTIRRKVLAAREQAGQQTPVVDRLLRLELYENALERIREVKALRPDLAGTLASRERAAWLGAASDHYLAGNFNEAFALYEHLLSLTADLPPEITQRWTNSLGQALSEGDFGQPIHPDACRRLQARVTEILPRIQQPLVRETLIGLLAERAGRPLDAGRAYAAALGAPWQLPPADQRHAAVARLRRLAVERLRALYDADRTRRRGGGWQIVLPGVWKHRRTGHFDVYARNDLVAERVAEAAEFHFGGLSTWLGIAPTTEWEPRCELRVYVTKEDLHQATDAREGTRALSQTRIQGQRVLLRKTDLVQQDPWLLGSTVPHQLTLLLLADAYRAGKLPVALETGLALQAEPPARRLHYRRRLGATLPNLADLLAAGRIPVDQPGFYAHCDVLTGLLLRQVDAAGPDSPDGSPITVVLRAFEEGYTPLWWKTLGWESEQALLKDWAVWYEARRDPPRMPLMILAQPPPGDRGDGS